MTRKPDRVFVHFNRVSKSNMTLLSMSQPAELAALISRIRQTVQHFDISIADEETRAGISDLENANYPLAARILSVRRNNLLATLSTLEVYSNS
jgi:hypothetical protein